MPDKTTQATLAICSPSAGTRGPPNARPSVGSHGEIAAARFGHEVSFSALPRPVPQNILPNRPVSASSAYLLLADGQGNTTLPRRPCLGNTPSDESLSRRRAAFPDGAVCCKEESEATLLSCHLVVCVYDSYRLLAADEGSEKMARPHHFVSDVTRDGVVRCLGAPHYGRTDPLRTLPRALFQCTAARSQ